MCPGNDMDRKRAPWRVLVAWTIREISVLDPARFALVMATGITSNAMWWSGPRDVSHALFLVDLGAYVWLVIATLVQAWRFPAALRGDLANRRVIFSFFTWIAASNIVGFELDLRGYAFAASALWSLALLVWLLLTYFSFSLLMLSDSEEGADVVVRGGWLLAVVATQSLVLLGTRLAASTLAPCAGSMFLLMQALWGAGVVLYGMFIVLFAHRVIYFPIKPQDLTPPLWVIMGAAAITANAGVALIQPAAAPSFLQSMNPFVSSVSLIAWGWGTGWIPLLAIFGIWKHMVRGFPLTCGLGLWSMVFPLGMYAVTTYRLSLAGNLVLLGMLSRLTAWIAAATWLATALGLLRARRRACGNLRGPTPSWRRIAARSGDEGRLPTLRPPNAQARLHRSRTPRPRLSRAGT